MAAPISINVTANAQGVYDEIIRQARRAEAIVKKIPLRIETKDLGGFKTLTADIDRFDKSVSRMSAVIVTFGQAAAVIFGIQNAFAAMVKSAINVEKKLTDINVIAKGSTNSLQKLSDGLFSIAKQTGQSFDVAATAAQEFSRQGLSVNETLKRTRDALTLTRIAGIDAAKATQSLTAIFNTFNKEALDTTRITNTLANLDVKFAVSVGDLTEALSRAGSTAADAKTSFAEMAAATTSLQQITARGGSVIGNSLKSIFTRLQRNDTVQALKEVGVNVRDLEGNMRPALKVLEELSKKFYTLSDAQRASIKEQVAGVYQVNQLSALLADLSSSYSVYGRALNEANKSQDIASDRLELLKNNTAGSLNDIVVNLTRFSGEVGKIFLKPLVKGNLDIVNQFLEGTKGFSDSEGAGSEIGKSVVKGLASYLGSGGALIVGKSLFNIFRLVVKGVVDQITAATTLNRTSEKQLQLQEQTKAVLLSQDAIIQRKIASTTTEAERQKVILGIIQEQTSAMLRLESVAARTAKFGISAGFSPVGGFKKGKTAAGGYMPSIMAEKHAINAGVGGASKNSKPVVVPNFNLGGGKRDTVVANSSEYIVPNFAGGDGSAIFNQKMIREYGLPRGAKRIAAGGYVPNFKTNKEIQLFRGLSTYGDPSLKNFSTENPPPIDLLDPMKYAKFKDAKIKSAGGGGSLYDKQFYNSRFILKNFLKYRGSDISYFRDLLRSHTGSSVPGLVSYSTNRSVANSFASSIPDSSNLPNGRSMVYSILFPKNQVISSERRLRKILDLPRKEKKELLKKGLGININRLLSRRPANNYDESEIAVFTKDIMQYAPGRALAGGHIPNFVFGGKKARNYKLDFFSPLDGKPRFEIPSPKELFSKAGNSMEELLGGKGKAYLGDIVNHKELFQNYPFLEDLPLSLLPKNSKDYGVHSGFGPFGKIKLNRNLNRSQAGGTLTHELQHAVQGVEGHFLGDDKLYSKFQDKDYAKYRLIPSEIEAITAQKRFEHPNLRQEFPDVLTSRIRSMLKEGGGHLDFAGGYVPNFGKSTFMGEGLFGSFHSLRSGIGVKKFKSRLNRAAGISIESRIKNAELSRENAIIDEYGSAKMLSENNFIPGVTAPKVFGTLKRSLAAKRIGKSIVYDKLAKDAIPDKHPLVSLSMQALFNSQGIGIDDLHEQNFTVNHKGSRLINSKLGGKLLDRAYSSRSVPQEVALRRLAKSFEKRGGLINIIDAGLMDTPPELVQKYTKASGYIPNFNPLKASLRREASSLQDLGYSKEEIFKSLRVQPSNRLKSKDNPSGLGVFNTLQGQHNISKALSDHGGENLRTAGVPNFATPAQATRDIFRFLRSIESGRASTVMGSRNLAQAPNAISTIRDIGANPTRLREVTARLANRIQRQSDQIDQALKVGNLNTRAEASLVNQKKYLDTALKEMVQAAKKDPISLKRPEILGVVSEQHERRVQTINQYKEQKARKRAEDTAGREKLEAERDKKAQEKEQKNQRRVLFGSFAVPLIAEGLSTALGGENTKGGRLASGLGSAASTALTLGSFGGPFGVGAGALVGGYQAFSAIQGSKESFTGQFSANKELQTEVDKINAQQESFGAFMDSATKLNDAQGGDKFAAVDKLNATLRSFEDKDLSSQLSKIAFDPNLSPDLKAKQQVEVFNKAEERQSAKTGIKVFRELYAQTTDLTNPLKRMMGEIDVAPDKIKKFANSLASTVGPDQLKSPITDQFVSDLIKKTGTNIESQNSSASNQIKAELKYILRSNQIQGGSRQNVEDSIASQFNLKKSASKFGQIQTQKDFQNKLAIDVFKTRSESPLVGETEKIKADRQASKAEIFAEFASQLGELQSGVVKQLAEKGGQSSKILDFTNNLLGASQTNDFSKVIDVLNSSKDTFTDMKDGEVGSIAEDVEKLVQASSNQLNALLDIGKAQDKNRRDAKILSLFEKMGVKGVENRGRGFCCF
jgi:TP901 family phage tail tape measure protein